MLAFMIEYLLCGLHCKTPEHWSHKSEYDIDFGILVMIGFGIQNRLFLAMLFQQLGQITL